MRIGPLLYGDQDTPPPFALSLSIEGREKLSPDGGE
jgi:hypothetical protein